MSDQAPLRPAAVALRPVVSVLARTLLGQAGTRIPVTVGELPRPLPLPGALAAPQSPPSSLSGRTPAWAQALGELAPLVRPLGEAVADLLRVARAADPGPARAELTALVERLQALGGLDDLDGASLRARLAAVEPSLEARLAAVATPRAGQGRSTLDLGAALGLEALLLRARAALPEGELRERVARVLATLESEQLFNLARSEHGDPPVLQLPLPDGHGWTAAWFQPRGRRGGAGREGDAGEGRLSVGITLSGLGPVRLDLALAPDLLRVRIAVSRPAVRAALERDLPLLLSDLERVGRPVAIGVELVDERDLGPPVPVVDGQLDVVG